MSRPKKNKIRMQIKIDEELKYILDNMNIDKSAYINNLLYKELVMSQFPSLSTQNSLNDPGEIRTPDPQLRRLLSYPD